MIKPINKKFLTEKDNPLQTDYIIDLYDVTNKNVKSVSIIVTEQCNLMCSYCYQKHKTSKKMDIETGRKAIDLLFDKDKLNGYYNPDDIDAFIIDFIGGEPFLEIELIDYLTEYFKYKAASLNHKCLYNSKISISSNGVLYRNGAVQDYLNRNSGMISLSISLDGNKQLHDSCRVFKDGSGSYDLAADALKDLRSKNEHASTKMTLCPENIIYTFDAIKNLYEEIGLHFVYANCVYEKGWTIEHANIFYNELIKLADWIIDNNLYDKFYCSLFSTNIGGKADDFNVNYCGGTGDMLAIGINGDCYPCLRYAATSLNNQLPIIIGNVDDGLLMKKSEIEINKYLNSITLKTQSPQKCLDCEVSAGCGLCSGYNYDEFGDANIRATYICNMHKARVKANKYFWDKLKKKVM